MDFRNVELLETNVMEQTPTEKENNQNWFQQFLDDYDYSLPKRGQILEGDIVRIDEDAVVVDIGLKRDGIVLARDLGMLDDEYRDQLAVGEKVVVVVLQTPVGDKELLVSIYKGLEQKDWQNALTVYEAQTVLDLEVVAHNKGGLLVQYGTLRGFLPASQVPELRRIRDPQRVYRVKQGLVGEQIAVKAVEVNPERKRLVFSALAAQEERRKKRLQELEKGQIIIQAKVVSVVDFGAFIDLDGVDGLVHVSELDWQKVRQPSELLKVGDQVDVKILDIDIENERVSLSRKALLPNPLEELFTNYQIGEVVTGKVTNILDFGAFVELEDGVVGLVHVSELGYSASGKPQELVKMDEKVLVRVLEIDPGRGRISLSMRRVPRDEQLAWIAGNLDQQTDLPEQEKDTTSLEAQETISGEITEAAENEGIDESGGEITAESSAEVTDEIGDEITVEVGGEVTEKTGGEIMTQVRDVDRDETNGENNGEVSDSTK